MASDDETTIGSKRAFEEVAGVTDIAMDDKVKAMSVDKMNLPEFTRSGRLELAGTNARLYGDASKYRICQEAAAAVPLNQTSEGHGGAVMSGDVLLHEKEKDLNFRGFREADRVEALRCGLVHELQEKYTKQQQKTAKLTKLMYELPTSVGFSHALTHVDVKEEFERFHEKTMYNNFPTRLYDFNMYGVHQKTSNVFCFLMSDTQRSVVIDRMVDAFDNGHGTMRDSYRNLFKKYSREVEYAYNRQNEDKKAKSVESTRRKWVEKLTQYFNETVHEVYTNGVVNGVFLGH